MYAKLLEVFLRKGSLKHYDQDYLFKKLYYASDKAYSDDIKLKTEITEKKLIKFKTADTNYLLSEHLKNTSIIKSRDIVCNSEIVKISDLKRPTIFIVNNTDFFRFHKSFEFLRNNENILLVGWDYDNNHWLSNSLNFASKMDIYIPFSTENLYLISKMNHFFSSPVELGSYQWKKSFLLKNIDLITSRKNIPGSLSGGFTYYPEFSYRNRIINKVSTLYPLVKFTNGYGGLSDFERIQTYLNSIAQLVVPVFNGVPNRLFDVLITGGVPIVTRALEINARALGIESCIPFSDDVIPEDLKISIKSAEEFYYKRNLDGDFLINLMNEHHIDSKINKILQITQDFILGAR